MLARTIFIISIFKKLRILNCILFKYGILDPFLKYDHIKGFSYRTSYLSINI